MRSLTVKIIANTNQSRLTTKIKMTTNDANHPAANKLNLSSSCIAVAARSAQ
jgi:hypothetical protein